MSEYPFEWCYMHDSRNRGCSACEIEYLNTRLAKMSLLLTDAVEDDLPDDMSTEWNKAALELLAEDPPK